MSTTGLCVLYNYTFFKFIYLFFLQNYHISLMGRWDGFSYYYLVIPGMCRPLAEAASAEIG